jgi:hypothetical protein
LRPVWGTEAVYFSDANLEVLQTGFSAVADFNTIKELAQKFLKELDRDFDFELDTRISLG